MSQTSPSTQSRPLGRHASDLFPLLLPLRFGSLTTPVAKMRNVPQPLPVVDAACRAYGAGDVPPNVQPRTVLGTGVALQRPGLRQRPTHTGRTGKPRPGLNEGRCQTALEDRAPSPRKRCAPRWHSKRRWPPSRTTRVVAPLAMAWRRSGPTQRDGHSMSPMLASMALDIPSPSARRVWGSHTTYSVIPGLRRKGKVDL